MKEWVSAIDETAMAIIVDERKDSNKLRKLTSFRNRSPTGQSPASKSRKSSAELLPPFKDKDKKLSLFSTNEPLRHEPVRRTEPAPVVLNRFLS